MTEDHNELDALSVSTIAIMAAILYAHPSYDRAHGEQQSVLASAEIYRLAEQHVQGAKAFRGDLP